MSSQPQGAGPALRIESEFETVNELLESRASQYPTKTYLIFQDRSYSYSEFRGRIQQEAGVFVASGVKPGDRVAILIPNSDDCLFAYFGAMHAGAIAVTINTLLKSEELEFILNDCGAPLLVTTPHYRKLLEPVWDRIQSIEKTLLVGPEAAEANYPDATALSPLLASAKAPQLKIDKSTLAVMIYTSGTTGHPKGVTLDHANLLYNSLVAHQLISLEQSDVSLCIMPLFHVNAQIASVMSSLQAGATLVLEEMFKPRSFIDTLRKYRCSTFSGVPTIYNYLNEMTETEGEKLDFLKACICGAAPMPVEVFQKFEQKFSARILEGYGLSEGTCVSSLNPLHGERKIGSIGVAIPGQEMAIWDDGNKPLPDGQIGEIVIRGPNVMRGYWNNPEATEQALTNGWLHTGDLGYRDEEGYYFISGRKKEMIIRGGENIYPKEIEEVLYQHEAVLDAAVVGVPDKKYGEEVAAFVILRPGAAASDKDLRKYLRMKVAEFKRPRILEIVHDLPRTATGKIQKHKIIEEYAGNQQLINRVPGHVHVPYRWVYGKAMARFYEGMAYEGRFYGTRCPKCKRVQCPPRSFCSLCFVEAMDWVELPNSGQLTSFTTVYMEFPGQPLKPPYTFAHIRLDGSNNDIYHIVGEIAEKDLRVGLQVEAVWRPPAERRGNLHDIVHFRPRHGG